MLTLQGLRAKTQWMTDQLRQKAIESTIERFKEAARIYYRQGYDNGESSALVRELMELGVELDYITDIEFAIRDEVEAENEAEEE